ncbi:MAG: hypothetical protein L0214_05030 [candidate division NC10 bacterium]|nr:hypothetical protein [candidate division NC10 bacterium]
MIQAVGDKEPRIAPGAILTGTAEAPLTVGAGVIARGGEIPARTLVLGNPATPKRAATEEEIGENRRRVEPYAALAQSYRTATQTAGEGGAT